MSKGLQIFLVVCLCLSLAVNELLFTHVEKMQADAALVEDDFASLMMLYEATDDGLGKTLNELRVCKAGVVSGSLCPKLGMPDRCLKQVSL